MIAASAMDVTTREPVPSGPLADLRAFPSYATLIEYAATRPTCAAPHGVASQYEPRAWHGRVDYAGALDMARTGWSAGAEAMQDAGPFDTGLVDVPVPALAMAGHYPRIPDYVAGNPESMVDLTGAVAPRRVHVGLSITVSAGVNGNWLRDEFAPAVAAFVRGLQASGLSVAVTGIDAGKAEDSKIGVLTVPVCSYGDVLDLDRVAFIHHPAFLRRVLFGVREMLPGWRGLGSACYGLPIPITPALLAHVLPDDAATVLMLPSPNDLGGASRAQLLVRFTALLNDACAAQ